MKGVPMDLGEQWRTDSQSQWPGKLEMSLRSECWEHWWAVWATRATVTAGMILAMATGGLD